MKHEIEYAVEKFAELLSTIDLKEREIVIDRFAKILNIFHDPLFISFSDFEHNYMAGEIARDITRDFPEAYNIPQNEAEYWTGLNTIAGFFHDVSNILISKTGTSSVKEYMKYAYGALNHAQHSSGIVAELLHEIFKESDRNYVVKVVKKHKNLETLEKIEFGIPVVMADDISTLVNYNRLLVSYMMNSLADIHQAGHNQRLVRKLNDYKNDFIKITDKGIVDETFVINELKNYKGVELNKYPDTITHYILEKVKRGPEESTLFKKAIHNAIQLQDQLNHLFSGVEIPDYKRVMKNYEKLVR